MGRLKKNIKEMSIANGKLWNSDSLETSLSSVKNSYYSLGAAEYEKEIKKMNILDLQNHATQVLVPLKENREILIKNLLREFSIRTGK